MSDKTMEQTVIEIPTDASIKIVSTSGNITVRGGAEKSELAVLRGKGSITETEEGVKVRTRPGGSSDIEISVPSGCHIAARAQSGDINVRGIHGGVMLQSMSGDVTVRRASGELNLRSVSGDVRLSAGQLTALSVDSVSGDVDIEGVLALTGDYEVRSVSGDITLRLPEHQTLTIDSISISGDLKCKLPHELETKGWGKVRAYINGGDGPVVRARTTSGDVRVKASKAQGPTPMPSPQPAESARVGMPEPEQAERDTRPLGDAGEPFIVPDQEEPFSLAGEAVQTGTVDTGDFESAGSRRMKILKSIEEGAISVAEGLEKLRSIE